MDVGSKENSLHSKSLHGYVSPIIMKIANDTLKVTVASNVVNVRDPSDVIKNMSTLQMGIWNVKSIYEVRKIHNDDPRDAET